MSHFEGKDALAHVKEKKEEIHGNEIPHSLSIAYECAKEVSVILLLFLILIPSSSVILLVAFACGLIAWKTGSAAFLGWSHLERLHRLIEQEKYEIEHHRPQEREELVALYGSKGFHGKLLDDVVDTLMADQDRLLKVMLEEEMGLTLEMNEHPLKQAFGAFLGSIVAAGILIATYAFFPKGIFFIVAAVILSIAAILRAKHESNRLISALIWTLSLAILSTGIAYFLSA